MWAGPLRQTMFMANFVRGGKVAFTTATVPGYIGTFNGQKSGAYAVDADERDQGEGWDNLWAMVS